MVRVMAASQKSEARACVPGELLSLASAQGRGPEDHRQPAAFQTLW